MPKTRISEYSTTNSANTDIESINIDEGCAPSGINNAIRELMVHLKEFQTGSSGDPLTVAGTFVASGGATIAASAGTSASPSIHFSSDTNTGIFSPAADTIAFAEGGVEAMRLDSSGNLGLGVTPSAWQTGSNIVGLDIGLRAAISAGNTRTTVWNNSYRGAGAASIYKATGAASNYDQDGGTHAWFTAPSGTAGNAISFTQAMTLDASGNLLVGITSARANAGDVQVSKGISFPASQSAQSDANTLDDYEEGTWTPTLPNGGTLTVNSARYVKIGQQVTVSFFVSSVAPTNNGSDFHIGGLPYANGGYSGFYLGGSFGYVGDSNLSGWLPATGASATYIYFHIQGATAFRTNAQYLTAASGGSDEFVMTITYFAAT